jgi:nucleoside phosphorylase/CheY-like chemotaxis protein
MKILIVDDKQEKITDFINHLTSISISREDISVVRDAHDARKQMKETKYDILILDIAIPERVENLENISVGLDLLNEISERDSYKPPAYILCVTALDEEIDDLQKEFEGKTWQLVSFGKGSIAWKSKISDAIMYFNRNEEIKRDFKYEIDVLIFCALKELELSEVLKLPFNWSNEIYSEDLPPYFSGKSDTSPDSLTVIASYASEMGMVATASTLSILIRTFRPRLVIMSGICAGVEGSTNLGDLIIADPTWDYQTGKFIENPNELIQLLEIRQQRILPHLRRRLVTFASSLSVERDLETGWNGNKPSSRSQIKFGALLSGSSVVASEHKMSEINNQDRKMLGLDMEVFGFYFACNNSISPPPNFFAVKCVTDFANPNKDDSLQKYGAFLSSKFVEHFICNNVPFIKSITS